MIGIKNRTKNTSGMIMEKRICYILVSSVDVVITLNYAKQRPPAKCNMLGRRINKIS